MLVEAIEIYVGILTEQNPSQVLKDKIARIENIFSHVDKFPLNDGDKEWVRRVLNEKRSLSLKEKMELIYDPLRTTFFGNAETYN
jgi:hypothetical protein